MVRTARHCAQTEIMLYLIQYHRSPDTAKVKSKMLYASSKEALKRVLVGVGIHLTATDVSELDREYIDSGVKKFL